MDVAAIIAQNPTLAGFLGAGAAGSLLYSAKGAAAWLWEKTKRHLTTVLEIRESEPAYYWVNDWLATLSSVRRARSLKVSRAAEASGWSPSDRQVGWTLGPGNGDLWAWWRGFLGVHRRHVEGKGANNGDDVITLTTLGRSQKKLRAVVAAAKELKDGVAKLRVFMWRGGWEIVPSKALRAPETLFLPDRMVEEAIADAGWFFANEEYHRRRGIPYRRGWLLEGEPRSGKTSLVAAVASHYRRPVYFVNPSSFLSDVDLMSAFAQMDPHGIALIEDADAAGAATKKRVDVDFLNAAREEAAAGAPSSFDVKDLYGSGCTLSGLLNSVDGMVATEGRLLVITSNFPDKIDPALLGGGRVGRRWRFELMQKPEAERMATAFFETGAPPAVRAALDGWTPMRAGDWQEALIAAAMKEGQADGSERTL